MEPQEDGLLFHLRRTIRDVVSELQGGLTFQEAVKDVVTAWWESEPRSNFVHNADLDGFITRKVTDTVAMGLEDFILTVDNIPGLTEALDKYFTKAIDDLDIDDKVSEAVDDKFNYTDIEVDVDSVRGLECKIEDEVDFKLSDLKADDIYGFDLAVRETSMASEHEGRLQKLEERIGSLSEQLQTAQEVIESLTARLSKVEAQDALVADHEEINYLVKKSIAKLLSDLVIG